MGERELTVGCIVWFERAAAAATDGIAAQVASK